MYFGLNQHNVGFLGALNGVSAPYVPSLQSVSFDYSSTLQTWTVPAGVTSVTGRLWGPGGDNSSYAGSGHYVAMGFATYPGNSLSLIVGSSVYGLFGSGRSEIVHTGIQLIAAGGGGAGFCSSPLTYYFGGNGGVTGYNAGGKGAISGAGGAAAIGGTSPGGSGGMYTGGNGGAVFWGIEDEAYGGAGGGGWYGGGGAGASVGGAGGGGGGGISLASGGYNIRITGNGPNWDGDSYWNGTAGTAMGDGRITLTYFA